MGLGLKPYVCPSFCQRWHSACADTFFEFDARSGALQACGQQSQNSVCARLKSIVSDGNALCQQSKLQVAEERARNELEDEAESLQRSRQRCFNGVVPDVLPVCNRKSVPSPASQRTGSSRPGSSSGVLSGSASAFLILGAAAVLLVALRAQLSSILQRLFRGNSDVVNRTSRRQGQRFVGQPKFAR